MAYYSEDLIEEVISRNDIVEVISEYVALKKSGRNYMGLCPFHREKSPSFCVSLDKQIYKCFGCSEGGNVITFISKLENLDFTDSLEFLADRAHIDLSKFESNNTFGKQFINRDIKETLFNINKEIGLYYHNNLMEILKKDNSIVKDYINRRKLDLKTITKFGLGFADGKVPLFDYLIEKGYKEEDIFATGIILKSERGKIYDRFFNRLIFPIFDIRGRTIAFGARVLDKSLPKYINSPENAIYIKGNNLYGLNFVKNEKYDSIIIVEGYMDAIALQKNGFTNVVASLGTALTQNQAKLLKKYSDKVIIGYDQDGAGQEATMRGLDILTSNNLNVKVLILDREDVKDPDEYINKYGPERFSNCINNSISLVEFKISKFEKEISSNDIDSKVKFLNKVSDVLAKINNDIERQLYIDKIAQKYDIGTGPILNEIEKKLNREVSNDLNINVNVVNKKINLVTDIRKRQEQYIIALLLNSDKSIQNQIIEKIKIEDIENADVRKVFEYILSLMQNYDISKTDILVKTQDEKLIRDLTDIMYIDISKIDKNKLLIDVLKNKVKEKLYLRRDEILKRENENISKDEMDILQFELNQINLELSKFKK